MEYVVIVAFVFFGCVAIVAAAVNFVMFLLSGSWPATAGRIISSQVVRTEEHPSPGKTVISYSPVINYEYTVGGKTYTSNRVSFMPSLAMKKVVSRYHADVALDVHYNPKKPAQSVLDTTMRAEYIIGQLFLVLIGLAFIAFAVFFFIVIP